MGMVEESAKGPNGVAEECEKTIARLVAERDALPRSERQAVNQRLHEVRRILAFCKSRAGYRP